MLVDDIKERFKAAMKARNVVEREILRVALGDIQMRDATSDEDVQAVLRKLLKANGETLGYTTDEAAKETLEAENAVLRSLLPASLTEADVARALEPVVDAIRAAQSDGQATGIAMKHLKAQSLSAEGTVVTQAVRGMRAGG